MARKFQLFLSPRSPRSDSGLIRANPTRKIRGVSGALVSSRAWKLLSLGARGNQGGFLAFPLVSILSDPPNNLLVLISKIGFKLGL